MNNNDFNNNMQPMNNTNPMMPGMEPQPNMNMGMPEAAPQPSMNMGMPEAAPQPNMNMGMPNMQPQYSSNPGMAMPSTKKPMNKGFIIGFGAVIVVAVVVVVLFATGIIGGKTLTCTTEETSMGMTMKEEIKVHFKDDQANKVVGKMTIVYGDNVEYKEYIEESFEEQLEELKEEGIDAKITSKKDSTTLIVTAKKADLEDAFGIYEEDGTSYEELKEYYEDSGYTCK